MYINIDFPKLVLFKQTTATAEPVLDDVMCAYPHSTTEVCPTTPDMPVFEHHSVSETEQNVATALHAIHTSQDRDVQFGGQ